MKSNMESRVFRCGLYDSALALEARACRELWLIGRLSC